MTREKAEKILKMPHEEAVEAILEIGNKAEKYDELNSSPENVPTRPSGMTPAYEKPNGKQRKKKPGRKNGHEGVSRTTPEKIDHYKEHKLDHCPDCAGPLKEPIKSYTRYTEDIPPVEPEVTEHKVFGYWCPGCKKAVFPRIDFALANSMIGIRVIVLSAWLHYLIGVSVGNVVQWLAIFANLKVSPGGLTQAWNKLAQLLTPVYDQIGQKVKSCAVLNCDETGWRLNGLTHWLWCFTNKIFCYYVITRSRGSPVVKRVLGNMFTGILICDFWGAYNKIGALARQRCVYHLFTELKKVSKYNQSLLWKAFRKMIFRLFRDAIRLWNQKEKLDTEAYDRRKRLVVERFQEILSTESQDKDVQRLIKRFARHQDEMFTFLDYSDVSPYNNHGEQQMRSAVMTRKVSQQNRSRRGADTQAILMTLFRSLQLQKQNPVEALLTMAKTSIKTRVALEEHFKLAV